MNNIKNLINITLFVIISNITIAQAFQCFTEGNINNNYVLLSQPSSCSNYLNYIPNPDNNYQNTPILTYRINIHIFRRSDGSGVYQPSDTNAFKQQVEWSNSIYSNINEPTLPVSPPASYIDDSRIRFKLMKIYFHDNDNFYSSNENCGSSYQDNFGINKDSEFNVFYYQNPAYPQGGGCGPFPYVNMYSLPLNWASAQLLAHELGHVIGLPHTGTCYAGSCYDDAFDDTFTPDCNQSWLSCGVNEISSCLNAQGISNNIMGYNICRNYLSPEQMGIIHENAISNYSYTKYLICDYNADNSTIVSANTTWNVSKIIRGDLTVTNNSLLTIQCSLIMSDLSTITINDGSALIVDTDAILTGLCGNFWSGKLIIEEGGSLIFKSNSQIRINDCGSIEIKSGGYICIENGANINLSDYLSVINLRPGFISGINPSLGITANCLTDPTTISITGNGEINTFTNDEFIQNITITTNKYFNGNNISAGYDVTPSLPYGNVIIQNAAHVIIDAANDVLLKNSIEVKLGSQLEIK